MIIKGDIDEKQTLGKLGLGQNIQDWIGNFLQRSLRFFDRPSEQELTLLISLETEIAAYKANMQALASQWTVAHLCRQSGY